MTHFVCVYLSLQALSPGCPESALTLTLAMSPWWNAPSNRVHPCILLGLDDPLEGAQIEMSRKQRVAGAETIFNLAQ